MRRLCEYLGPGAIVAAFFALGALYLRTTPLLETPDEPSHFSVVKYIADEMRLPPMRSLPSEAGPVPVILPGPPVYYAPPLYYALGALLIGDLNTDGFAQAVIPNPSWARDWAPTPGRAPENKHIYVHTADQRAPYAGWAAAMMRLRVLSLLLGGITVVGVYTLARMVWTRPSERGWVAAATALVAFNPAFVFVTVGVTNDALLVALSTWSFVLMARLVRLAKKPSRFDSRGLVALLGVDLGLAALTKQSALAFFPVAVLALVWGTHAQPQPGRAVRKWLFLLWLAPVVLLAGWWYLRNALAFSDPLGFEPHQPTQGEWTPPLSLLVDQMGEALRGYWGTFGWGLILVEPVIYVLIAAFCLFGLLGWLRRPAWGSSIENQQRIVKILGLATSLNLIGFVLWLWHTSAPYGRLLFPTLGPLAVLLVMGWQRWLGPRYSRPFAWVVVLTACFYATVVPGRYLQPAYASPVVSPAKVKEATPLDVHFDVRAYLLTPTAIQHSDTAQQTANELHDGALQLLGYQMTPDAAKPGDRVTLTLYWRTTASLTAPLTIFVQVAPKDAKQWVAGVDDFLGSSRYPSQVWQPGETIRQVHQLRLPDDTPAPGRYWFAVGLYGESDRERVPITADGTRLPSGALRLGPLRVLSQDNTPPRQRVDYHFGSAIRLAGYDVDLARSGSPGGSKTNSVTVTLYWQALATPTQDLTAFVHLLDADGRLVAQHDSPPRQGNYPTREWREGDRVPDPHTLLIPPDLKPGHYQLLVGLYRPGDATRIPAFDGSGKRVPNDAVVLTDVYWPDESEQGGN